MSSAALSTPASQTSPLASASGWLGSWRRVGWTAAWTTRSTVTVAIPGLSSTVRKTGRSARNAPSRVLETELALARFDAVVFIRMSCADMARPAISKTDMGRLVISFSLPGAADRRNPALEERERGAILDRIFGEERLLGGKLDRIVFFFKQKTAYEITR